MSRSVFLLVSAVGDGQQRGRAQCSRNENTRQEVYHAQQLVIALRAKDITGRHVFKHRNTALQRIRAYTTGSSYTTYVWRSVVARKGRLWCDQNKRTRTMLTQCSRNENTRQDIFTKPSSSSQGYKDVIRRLVCNHRNMTLQWYVRARVRLARGARPIALGRSPPGPRHSTRRRDKHEPEKRNDTRLPLHHCRV